MITNCLQKGMHSKQALSPVPSPVAPHGLKGLHGRSLTAYSPLSTCSSKSQHVLSSGVLHPRVPEMCFAELPPFNMQCSPSEQRLHQESKVTLL